MIDTVHTSAQCGIDAVSTMRMRGNLHAKRMRCIHNFLQFIVCHLLAGTGCRVR